MASIAAQKSISISNPHPSPPHLAAQSTRRSTSNSQLKSNQADIDR
jgi:hypothetical protein